MSWRGVTKEEFDAFIEDYPNELERNITMICEPLNCNYNDFTTGLVWPESIVASYVMNENYPKDGKEPYRWSPNVYVIRE